MQRAAEEAALKVYDDAVRIAQGTASVEALASIGLLHTTNGVAVHGLVVQGLRLSLAQAQARLAEFEALLNVNDGTVDMRTLRRQWRQARITWRALQEDLGKVLDPN